MSRYLNDHEMHAMARAAVNTFEMTASWAAARRAALEYAQDTLRVTPRNSALLLALKQARVRWEARRMQARRAVDSLST
jgi:hypothetical protein